MKKEIGGAFPAVSEILKGEDYSENLHESGRTTLKWILRKWDWIPLARNRDRWKAPVNTVMSVNMTVFWDVKPCRLVEVYRRFRSACCLHNQDDDD
jgi:hypothetical protein